MNKKILVVTTLLGASLCGHHALGSAATLAFSFDGIESAGFSNNSATDPKEEALYSEGTRAVNDGNWAAAEAIFARIAQQHGDRADAAVYWQAYAENKQGKSARALESCAQLRRDYPHSLWIDECGALEIEVRGKNGDPVPPQSEHNEDLKLLALNSLMQQDQSRALPVIQQILNSDKSERLKDRALFVLAQNDSQQAQSLMNQIARGQADAALQRKAIEMLAVAHGAQSSATLAEIYTQSSNEQIKKAVLQAYLITGNPDPLVQAALHESNPDLNRSAVQTLGAMGAVPQLIKLYQGTASTQTKAAIIDGMIAAGPKGANALETISSTERDPELRSKAIRNMGISGGAGVTPSLVASYRKNTDYETRKAVLQALFLAGDSHDLVELARAEKDSALRQEIIQQLSLMHSKEANDYMVEILNK